MASIFSYDTFLLLWIKLSIISYFKGQFYFFILLNCINVFWTLFTEIYLTYNMMLVKRCTCWFGILIYYGVVAIVVIDSTSVISCNYHFFFVVGVIKIQSFSKFEYYTILSITTMLCIGSLEFSHICLQVCTLKQHLSYSPTPQPLTSISLSVFMSLASLDSICKWYHTYSSFSVKVHPRFGKW